MWWLNMNLIDLEAFVAVVDHGSIVAASAILLLTQSAVTRRIQNLEDALAFPCSTVRAARFSPRMQAAKPMSSQGQC